MSSYEFYDEHLDALRKPDAVLRDSIEILAVRILENKRDLSKITEQDYPDALNELRDIIKDLQYWYNKVRED